ncbi:MAG: hypothetical protein LJE58_14245 [Thiogranum sp.]|jgi:hypothetical protein|nr:hypothetical protein [Thiogranum sp.]
MMNIKDLSISKELDRKAMTDVRGGFQDFHVDTGALLGAVVSSNGGVGSPTIVTQVAPVTSTVIGIDLDLSHLLG